MLADVRYVDHDAVLNRRAYDAFHQLMYLEDKAEADRKRLHQPKLQK